MAKYVVLFQHYGAGTTTTFVVEASSEQAATDMVDMPEDDFCWCTTYLLSEEEELGMVDIPF